MGLACSFWSKVSRRLDSRLVAVSACLSSASRFSSMPRSTFSLWITAAVASLFFSFLAVFSCSSSFAMRSFTANIRWLASPLASSMSALRVRLSSLVISATRSGSYNRWISSSNLASCFVNSVSCANAAFTALLSSPILALDSLALAL